jgi:hypothetical protein
VSSPAPEGDRTVQVDLLGGDEPPEPDKLRNLTVELVIEAPCFEARTSVAVPGRDAAFVQLVQHGGVIAGQVLADSCQGPAEVVEVDGAVDLLW